MKKGRLLYLISLVLIAVVSFSESPIDSESNEFHLYIKPEKEIENITGRIFVLLNRDPNIDPIFDHNIVYAVDVSDLKIKSPVIINKNAVTFPYSLEDIPNGEYSLRAVADINPNHWDFTFAPGNIYSEKIVINISDTALRDPIQIILDKVVKKPVFKETELHKEVRVRSQLLSDFYGYSVNMEAAVILPPSYSSEPEKSYPVVYTMPGYGGSHYHISQGNWNQKRYGMNRIGMEKIFIFLDLDCPLGYHCFADSDNNGPRSRALVEELIPFIEKNYRIISKPSARLLTGQSSGAWASLWIQINYPDFFGGVWSVSPDPVDFRSFCGLNLYEEKNVFMEMDGSERPLIVEDNKTILTWRVRSGIEAITGWGGWLNTFEAQFSPKEKNGFPEMLWNRQTGEINPEVVEHWKQYDIRLYLKNNWKELKPKLSHKIHIFVADDDTARLDDPIRLLQKDLLVLGSDAAIKILSKGGHGDGVWRQIIDEIHSQMDALLIAAHPELGNK